jgi:hypothetical protein
MSSRATPRHRQGWPALAAGALLAACAACTAPNPAFHGRDGSAVTRPDAPDTMKLPLAPDARLADGPSTPDARPADGPPAASTLLGYWKLDERADATMAVDSSGRGNHGILEGLDAHIAWVSGYRGNALDLGTPGQTAGVRVPVTPALASLTSFTAAAWVYHTASTTTYDSIISRQVDDTVLEVFNLALIDDAPVALMPKTIQGNQVSYKVISPRTVPINQWVHLALTFDGTTVRLYQAGEEVGSLPFAYPLPATQTPLYLGTNKNPTNNEPFDGRIDDVLLYSSALSASAIAALAAGGNPPPR